jgi:hypothetical protein
LIIENVSSKSCRPCDDSYPAAHRPPKEEIDRRLHDANDAWCLYYDDCDIVERRSDPSTKHTTFSPKEDWEEIDEDPMLSDELRLSRTSDVERRRADHSRMERLIGPILSQDHRQKMWNAIHSNETS